MAILTCHAAATSDGLLYPKVRDYIEDHIDRGFINGLTIGILAHDKVEIHAFGTVSPTSGAAPNAGSVYQIASFAKVFNWT